MSRFLFVIFEGGGNVPVQLAIAARLVARGHAVRVLGDPVIEHEAHAVGASFAPFRHAPHHNLRDPAADRVRDWGASGQIAQFERFARELMFGPAEAYARDVLEEIERAPVDAVAVDYLVMGAAIGAERSGLPAATLMHTPYALPVRGVPPFGMGFLPARGPFGRLRDRVLGGLQERMFQKLGRAPVNAARAAFGLAPLASVFEQPLRSARILVMTSRSFDFAARAELPANVVYTGPELLDPAWTGQWRSPWDGDAKEPLVVVALGSTFQAQGPVTQRVADAIGQLPVRGLLTLGGVLDPSELRLPPNVVAVRAAPHRAVLPEASLVVAHGGHGTVMKALSFGKKLLCIPLGRDQRDNAVRVEAANAGLSASKGAGVRALRRAIERMLAEPRFEEGARVLRDAIAADVAEDRAVAELEALAGQRARASSASEARSGTTRSGAAAA